MFCPKCGKENDNGAKFCAGCGASLVVNSNVAGAVTSTTNANNTVNYNNAPNMQRPVYNNGVQNIPVKKKGAPIALIIIAAILMLAFLTGAIFGVTRIFKNKKGSDVASSSNAGNAGNADDQQTGSDDITIDPKNSAIPAGDFHPEKYADYERMENLSTWSLYGLSEYDSLGDFIVIEGDSYKSYFAEDIFSEEGGSYYENLIKGKNIEYVQTFNYANYVVTADGTNYMFNRLSDGFYELEKGSVYPTALDDDAAIYVMPTSDDGTIGDLFFINSFNKTPILLARNVVGSSTGVAVRQIANEQIFYFYYEKYEDGKYSLAETSTTALGLLHGEDFELTERIIAEGNTIPLYADDSDNKLYYYDLDEKTIYYSEKGEAKQIYQGEYDEIYFFHIGEMLVVKGDDLYYFDRNLSEEATLVLSTGLDHILCKSPITKQGYNNVNMVCGDVSASIVFDKNGAQYILDGLGHEVGAVEIPHDVNDPTVDYYMHGLITYIEDGVLLIDEVSYSGIKTYVKFDKERVVDYCSNLNGSLFFVFTEQSNVYYRNISENEDVLIDSGVEYNAQTGCNFAVDPSSEYLIYGKDGQMKAFDYLDRGYTDELTLEHGYFVRDGSIFIYFYKDGSDEKYYLYNNRACSIF
ncbi:zinc ribbon domain-containing protein [Butyrivibrio proteoclasticus]|uniref:zinc ribbon domain-containing protein n=1 Tax=Butyrivibrio proteoclasticus TaxID=43305 RepID=UPI00047A7888|nr:zinc ribbon domain-containing protein [Butyrivibrio proteoclasticus]